MNIERAKQHWEIIRKKKTVLKILNHVRNDLGSTMSFDVSHMKQEDDPISKFIINPENP